MKNIYTQESGRSMIEMLGVLAIIGVLSVGGIAGYSQAMNKFKVTKTTDQIQTMVQNIRTLFSSQKNYAGLETGTGSALLYTSGILTDENCPNASGTSASCSLPINPYGGEIKIVNGQDDYTRANRAFGIGYGGLSPDACVRLATQNWGDSASGLISVTVGTGTMSMTNAPTTSAANSTVITKEAGTVPMSLANAAGGCGTGGNTSYMILWYK